MSKIKIENTDTGRLVLLLDDDETVGTSWFVPSNPHTHGMACPPGMAEALVDRVQQLTAPPWQGLDKVAKTQVRNVIKWIADEALS